MRTVPLPPMPTNPDECRWCTAHLEAGYCPNGCRPATAIPHVDEVCEECHRRFQTGQKWASICWQCERRELAELDAAYEHEERQITGYLHDRIMVGANRQAMKLKDKG